MKAAFITQTGSPEVIQVGELPMPRPQKKEALIRVSAVATNPIDTYFRSGLVPMPAPFPYVIGCDFVGVIEELGEDTENLSIGQRVWGSNQGMLGRQGTFAEFICVNQDWIYPAPEGVEDIQIVAASLTAITAHLGLFQFGDLQEEDTVFINGGTGGVGSMAVQIAKAKGARVITTVGSAEKTKIAEELGADLVLNYKTDDLSVRIKEFTAGKGVQVWYETHREQDFGRIIDLMSPRGRVIVMAGRQSKPIIPIGPFYVKCLSLHGFAMFNCTPMEQWICAEEINDLLTEQKLKALIGLQLPLEQAALAHKVQETGTLPDGKSLFGKVVLTI